MPVRILPCFFSALFSLVIGCCPPPSDVHPVTVNTLPPMPPIAIGGTYAVYVRFDSPFPSLDTIKATSHVTNNGNQRFSEYFFVGTLQWIDSSWVVVQVDSTELIIPREKVSLLLGDGPPKGKPTKTRQ